MYGKHLKQFCVPSGDQTGECRAHGNLGSAFFSKGNYRESLSNHRHQLVLAMKLKDREVRHKPTFLSLCVRVVISVPQTEIKRTGLFYQDGDWCFSRSCRANSPFSVTFVDAHVSVLSHCSSASICSDVPLRKWCPILISWKHTQVTFHAKVKRRKREAVFGIKQNKLFVFRNICIARWFFCFS